MSPLNYTNVYQQMWQCRTTKDTAAAAGRVWNSYMLLIVA